MFRSLTTACGLAAAGTVFGAVTHDSVITWGGVIVAVGSTLVSAGIASYHKVREAARDEDRKDRAAQLEDIRILGRVQMELETRLNDVTSRANKVDSRITLAETRSQEISDTIERVRCKYPTVNGEARCAGATPAPDPRAESHA